jgi:hypothetical protein
MSCATPAVSTTKQRKHYPQGWCFFYARNFSWEGSLTVGYCAYSVTIVALSEIAYYWHASFK